MCNLRIIERSVDSLGEAELLARYTDLCSALNWNRNKIIAYQKNPYLKDRVLPGQFLGIVDDKIVGQTNPFPIELVANGVSYDAVSGSNLIVHQDYRATGCALDFMDKMQDLAPSGALIAGGISTPARLFYKGLKAHMFYWSTIVIPYRSEARLRSRLHGISLTVASFFANLFLSVLRLLARMILAIYYPVSKVTEVSATDENKLKTVVSILEQDTHLFREKHDEKWFKWVLENAFHENVVKRLFLVYKKDVPIGFFLTKVVETTNNPGKFGTVIEWGVTAKFEGQPHLLLLMAMLSFDNKVDSVSVGIDDKNTLARLNWLTWLKGVSYIDNHDCAIVLLTQDSPLRKVNGIGCQDKWRIRPATGDVAFF